MNRSQRRATARAANKLARQQKITQSAVNIQENIDEIPTARLIVGINSFLVELEKRGMKIRDWDNDARALHRIQIKHGRYYFLTEGGDDNEHSV